MPRFLCIFRLTSTGMLAQIETARRKLPQVVPALWFKLYGEPALATPTIRWPRLLPRWIHGKSYGAITAC